MPPWQQCTSCPPLHILRPPYFLSPFQGVQRTKAQRKGMWGCASFLCFTRPMEGPLPWPRHSLSTSGVQDAGFKACAVPSPTSLWGVLIVCCFACKTPIFLFSNGFQNCFCFVCTLSTRVLLEPARSSRRNWSEFENIAEVFFLGEDAFWHVLTRQVKESIFFFF